MNLYRVRCLVVPLVQGHDARSPDYRRGQWVYFGIYAENSGQAWGALVYGKYEGGGCGAQITHAEVSLASDPAS